MVYFPNQTEWYQSLCWLKHACLPHTPEISLAMLLRWQHASFLSGCTAVNSPCGNTQIPILGNGCCISVKTRSAHLGLQTENFFKYTFLHFSFFPSILRKLKCIKNSIYQKRPFYQMTGYGVKPVLSNQIQSVILDQYSRYIDPWKRKSHFQEKIMYIYTQLFVYINACDRPFRKSWNKFLYTSLLLWALCIWTHLLTSAQQEQIHLLVKQRQTCLEVDTTINPLATEAVSVHLPLYDL